MSPGKGPFPHVEDMWKSRRHLENSMKGKSVFYGYWSPLSEYRTPVSGQVGERECFCTELTEVFTVGIVELWIFLQR